MLDAGVWMEREAMLHLLWVTQQYRLASMDAWLSSTFVAFPTTVSSLTSLQSVSPHSAVIPTLRLLHNPETPALSLCAFQGTCIPV